MSFSNQFIFTWMPTLPGFARADARGVADHRDQISSSKFAGISEVRDVVRVSNDARDHVDPSTLLTLCCAGFRQGVACGQRPSNT